jgi:glyoxylase-like metal-dependent hydrolase (beta-lactamase superfamily II)
MSGLVNAAAPWQFPLYHKIDATPVVRLAGDRPPGTGSGPGDVVTHQLHADLCRPRRGPGGRVADHGRGPDADRLAAAQGRNLTTIYITHGHGDDFFGAPAVLERFPTARMVGAGPGGTGSAGPDTVRELT